VAGVIAVATEAESMAAATVRGTANIAAIETADPRNEAF